MYFSEDILSRKTWKTTIRQRPYSIEVATDILCHLTVGVVVIINSLPWCSNNFFLCIRVSRQLNSSLLYRHNPFAFISDLGASSQSSFIYETFKKYHGEVQYKVVNAYTTTLWVSPTSTNSLKNNLDQLSALPYIFMWLAIATLLRQYYKSIRRGAKKFPFKFWIVLAVPLIFIFGRKQLNIFNNSRYTIQILL